MSKSDELGKKIEKRVDNQLKKADEYADDLVNTYRDALNGIRKEIEAFYGKYAKENNITIEDAKKKLTNTELKDFKRQLDKYIKNNVSARDKRFVKAMKNLQTKKNITRLMALETEVSYHLQDLYEKYQDKTETFLANVYKDNYYRTIYDIQTTVNVGTDFKLLNDRVVKKAITEKWSSKSYSERIWGQKDRLFENIKKVISHGIIKGESVVDMSKSLAERMDVGYSDAKRLILTETNYVINQGTLEG